MNQTIYLCEDCDHLFREDQVVDGVAYTRDGDHEPHCPHCESDHLSEIRPVSDLEIMKRRILTVVDEIFRRRFAVEIEGETITLDHGIHFEKAAVVSTRSSILGSMSHTADGWRVWVEYPEQTNLDPYGTHYEDIGEFSHWDLAVTAAVMKLSATLTKRITENAA